MGYPIVPSQILMKCPCENNLKVVPIKFISCLPFLRNLLTKQMSLNFFLHNLACSIQRNKYLKNNKKELTILISQIL